MQSKYCKNKTPTLDTRIRAIFCCIWFGTMPWQLYEHKKHYGYDYLSHLKLNWKMVLVWLTSLKIDAEELEFEQKANPDWNSVYKNMCAGLR
tara:strand:- start:956 stop:1231 length:276 start_codon:yes stop_codon:yes gene_type:complete